MDRYTVYNEIIEQLEKAMEDETIDYTVDNDGIGPYEYWGAKGYDAGTDYLLIENDNVITVKLENVPTRLLKLAALDLIENRDQITGTIPAKDDRLTVYGKIDNVTVKNHAATITVVWDETQDRL